MYDLTGKTAVITGGSSGIGEAAAYALAVAGAHVVIGDISEDRALVVANAINKAGYSCEARYVDVTDERSVDSLIDGTVHSNNCIDILFSNAGILLDQKFEEITSADWKKVMDVNVTGTFYACRAAIRHMKQRKYGKIIITSSVGGKMSHPTAGVHYISSKGALMAFTRHLANQVGQYGINVNSIAPGTTMTPMIAHRGEKVFKAISDKIPMGRLGASHEMAGAVLYLSSDQSSFITGEIVDVNGGLYID